MHLHLDAIDAEVADRGLTIVVRTESRGGKKPGKRRGKLVIRNRKLEWFAGRDHLATGEANWDELIEWLES